LPVRSAEKAPADFVLLQQGTLPIILTAPHGGRDPVPGIPARDVSGNSRPTSILFARRRVHPLCCTCWDLLMAAQS
jgi:hypothetical protein